MNKLTLSSAEKQRINEVLNAAAHGSWHRFSALSDEPFLNTEAMQECFEKNKQSFVYPDPNWDERCRVTENDDGTRIISIKLIPKEMLEQGIELWLHSDNDSAESKIGIWLFFRHIDIR